MSGTFEDLKVWQHAMKLVYAIYDATRKFPANEMYGLTSQLRRAAVSVASNIAEGKGRGSDKELVHFLSQARGSLYEVHTQLIIARHQHYVPDGEARFLLDEVGEVGRILNGFIRSFRTTSAT